MDVRSVIFKSIKNFGNKLTYLLLLSVLISCQKQKTTESVFSQTALDPCLGTASETKFIVQWEDGRFSVESGVNREEFKNNFVAENLAAIRHVQGDIHLQVYNQLDGIRVEQSATKSMPWHIVDTGADQVWSQNVKGQGIRVAVVDSWIDKSHPQLKTRLYKNTREIPGNGIDDDGNGYVDDYEGYDFSPERELTERKAQHGSHVSGIILADPLEDGAKGMAPEAELIAAPFMMDSGSGSLADAILALQYSADQGARIINNSWGSCGKVDILENVFQEISNKGVLVVTAAGNESVDVDTVPVFPSSYNLPTQLNIAATDPSGYMTYWSNRGFKKVHFAAPGDAILSTVPNGVGYLSGTSMAAPVVSGAAALLWSAYPSASVFDIRAALIESVDVLTGKENRTMTRGKLNVQKALEKLKLKFQ